VLALYWLRVRQTAWRAATVLEASDNVSPFFPPVNRRQLWHLWAKALGEKTGRTTSEADRVALIRSVIFLTYFLTNCFIVAGVIRHWNN
jgi:hypothetical protein